MYKDNEYLMDDLCIQADFLQLMEKDPGNNPLSPHNKEAEMSSQVTDSKVFPYNEGGPTKAFGSVTLNGDFVIRNLRVVEGRNGLFVSFPSKWKESTKKNHDIAFPITASLRALITQELLTKYENPVVEEVPEEQVA